MSSFVTYNKKLSVNFFICEAFYFLNFIFISKSLVFIWSLQKRKPSSIKFIGHNINPPKCKCLLFTPSQFTGASFLNFALIAINAKVSKKSQVTGCQSYTHLVLFNGLSFMLAASATNVASGVLYNAGETLAAEYTQGVTFLMSMYRIIFLSLDSLYYACTEEEDDEQEAFRDKQGPGEHITIQM